MCRGGQVMGQVAQVVLDLPEGLVLRQIDEAFGHQAEGALGLRPEPVEEGLDAGFTAIRGL